jgi:hypothetical protein
MRYSTEEDKGQSMKFAYKTVTVDLVVRYLDFF